MSIHIYARMAVDLYNKYMMTTTAKPYVNMVVYHTLCIYSTNMTPY